MTPTRIKRFPVFSVTSRTVQVGWLLFALPALSLALTGIIPFHQLLQTTCTGTACLIGQLTPTEAAMALAFVDSLPEYADSTLIIYLFTYTLLFLAAVIFIWRKPLHAAAVCGAFFLTALATENLALVAAYTNPTLLLPAQFIYFVQLAALLPFFCFLPDGRFQPAWFRWVTLALVPAAFLVAFNLVGVNTSHIIGSLIGLLIASMVVVRYQSLHASPPHEQMAWALAAVALLAGAQWVGRPVRPLPLPAISLEAIPPTAFGFFPVLGTLLVVGTLTCLVVALLNDELFRVEVALNRALVYTLLTLFVVGVYVLIVGYLSLLFQSSGSLWFSLVATGLVAALFQPVRQRVQHFVNTMLYGERAEPYEVITRLGQRLEAAFAAEDILATIAQMVQESLRLPYAAISLAQDGASEVVAAAGMPTGDPVAFPLTYQGIVVGRLLVNPRRGDTELSTADRHLLTDLAQQAGVAVHSVRLTAELRLMTESLQQSRERLVLAREEERRRLRRDLHDDLAPTLIGLSLRAGTISDLIAAEPDRARQLADHLDSAIREAVSNIRRLVYDLRPPALDDLGLLTAIRERAAEYSSRELWVEVDAPETLPPLPAAVEVAAYRIAQEGLLNVVKHAQAQTCRIHLRLTDGLLIEISDDGFGLPHRLSAGVGLHSIQERAAELGGTCEIKPGPHKGTLITVCLPVSNREDS